MLRTAPVRGSFVLGAEKPPSHLIQEIPCSRGKYPRSEELTEFQHHFLPLPDIFGDEGLGDILWNLSSHYISVGGKAAAQKS